MSAHGTPEQIHAKLSHPVIDGDGHWIEYTPVFAEGMRKVVGDKGADGFIASQRRIPDARITPNVPSSLPGGGGSGGLNFDVSGPDIDILNQVVAQLRAQRPLNQRLLECHGSRLNGVGCHRTLTN